MDRPKPISPIKNKNFKISLPYKFPPSFLINSIDSPSQSIKSCDKSVIEEETTCLTKFALKTLSNENVSEAKVTSPKTVIEDFENSFCLDKNFKILKTILEMRNQVLRLRKGLNKNKEALDVLDYENNLLTEKKSRLQERLREKFDKIRRSRKSFNFCFF